MLLGMDIDLPPAEPPDPTIDPGGGGTGGFPYNPYIEEYLYTDEFGRDDEFDWFGDDWYGWGEDWGYEEWAILIRMYNVELLLRRDLRSGRRLF